MLSRSRSIKLFDVFGFRVGVDASWFLILFLMIFVLSAPFRRVLHSSDGIAYLTTVVSVLWLFGSLIVHELGHALVARRQGLEVKQIDLFLFGGLTTMSRDAASPGEDFKIAIAGPAATLLVILVCLGVDVAIVGFHRLQHAIWLDSDIHITPVLLSLSWLLAMNGLLLFFNLLPAFPLDGGRVVRSIVWRLTGDKRRGTVAAARLGQGLGIVLAGLGLWWLLASASFGGLWLIMLGWLFRQSARGAIIQSALTERIEGVKVADVMDEHPVAIPADTPAETALNDFFLRYGWAWFPVVDEHGRLTGIARRERIQSSVDAGEGWVTIGSLSESSDADGAAGWLVGTDRPLTDVLGSESLGRLGAVMAVDSDGVLRGVLTVDQVRRAVQSVFSGSAA